MICSWTDHRADAVIRSVPGSGREVIKYLQLNEEQALAVRILAVENQTELKKADRRTESSEL